MPYPKGFLESRAVIKAGIFTIIPLQKGGLSIPSPVLRDANLRLSPHQNMAQALSSMSEALKQEEKQLSHSLRLQELRPSCL